MKKSLSDKLNEPIPIDDKMNIKDLENDPYFLTKYEKAVELISKYGIPDSFRDKKKKTNANSKKAK